MSELITRISLVSLFIRAPDLGFLKPLCGKARFFVFDPVRKIHDTNRISALLIWEMNPFDSTLD